MTKSKILVLDIDGTLVRGNSAPDNDVVVRIKQARNLGWQVVLATGRRLVDIGDISKLVNPHFKITSEGATVSNECSVLKEVILPSGAVSLAAQTGLNNELTPIYCREDAAFVHEWSPAVDRAVALGVSKPHVLGPHRIPRGLSLLLLVAETQERISSAAISQIKHLQNVSSSISAPGMVSITLPNVSKGLGLDWLLRHALDVKRCDAIVVAAGDSHNDVTLAERSDYFIAMEDGVQEIKEMANFVAPAVEKGGIEKILGQIMLLLK